MHSIVDILGLNPISMTVFDSAAAAIAGMARAYADRPPIAAARPAIAATMLGNTTRPLMHIRPMVEAAGRDLVIFHANGVGGRAMEEGIAAGWFAGVLDYTLSEIAGNLFGGFHDGGAARLLAAGRAGIPQVVVPGCLDFIVFGARHEVPPHLTDRPMYYHNPEFTLVRLTMEEQLRAVDAVAERLNASASPVEVCIPARGISIMDDVNGGAFWDEAISAARIDRFRAMLRPDIPCRVIDAHINDAAFAESALAVLHALL
jgi:uncharacterized protein (UPF0261 family)